MTTNPLLERWREGGAAVGGWLAVGNAYTAELMGMLGFHWLCIDLQHGQVAEADLHSMLPAIAATPTVPLVRVAWNRPEAIMKALDAGAMGVIVPMVNDAGSAREAVRACRYPPQGLRSFGPIRAGMRGLADPAEANRQIACIVMIETQQALDNIDEILAVPGIDAIYVGPSDLGLARGRSARGDTDEAGHAEDVEYIAQRAQQQGVVAGIHTSSLAYAQRWLAVGFRMVTLGSDSGFMARAAAADLKALRRH